MWSAIERYHSADSDGIELRVGSTLAFHTQHGSMLEFNRYILAFVFNQAGEMHYEVCATGILSTAPINPGDSVPWGTAVHYGVLAQYHQHLLSLRVDPAIGGYESGNRLADSECYAMSNDDFNPHGNGYVSKTSMVDKPGGLHLDASKNRSFVIQNDQIRNHVNHLPISYKIQVPPMQGILAHKDSFHFKRAEFDDHSIYLTKYGHHELFSGGKYTNQSKPRTRWSSQIHF